MPTSGFQDYSALVDPRTLPSSFDIDSILGEDDTLDLSIETSLTEDTRSRSLKSSIEAIEAGGEEEKKTAEAGEGNDGIDFDSEFVAAENDKEVTRRRKREVPVIEESAAEAQDQFPDVEGVSDFLLLYR